MSSSESIDLYKSIGALACQVVKRALNIKLCSCHLVLGIPFAWRKDGDSIQKFIDASEEVIAVTRPVSDFVEHFVRHQGSHGPADLVVGRLTPLRSSIRYCNHQSLGNLNIVIMSVIVIENEATLLSLRVERRREGREFTQQLSQSITFYDWSRYKPSRETSKHSLLD